MPVSYVPPVPIYSMAKSVEDIIRKQGAVPATIALIDGKAHIGLTTSQLEKLADTSQNSAVKVSRRDIGYTLSKVCMYL